MRASLRRGIAACAAIPLLILLAAPAAQAEEPSDEPSTLADRIVEAAEAGASTPEQFAEEVSLPVDGGGSLDFDADQRIAVAVTFAGAPSEEQLAALSEAAQIVSPPGFVPVATVRVHPERLAELAELPGVVSATPSLSPFTGADRAGVASALRGQLGALETRAPATAQAASAADGAACGPIPIEADAPLGAAEARERFGADGTGVTVGIISDSFATVSAPTSWADDVASGALPGPGNPCGRTEAVELIADTRPGGDEGRAMAQLVHGIAPGAKLIFADAGLSDAEMANNIVKLQAAGADIIVDDITWPTETYYQQGFISSAIEHVKSEGTAYFTSAGNSTGVGSSGASSGRPLSSWQTTAYRATPCPAWLLDPAGDPLEGRTFDCLDFDPDPAVDVAYDTLRIRGDLSDGGALLQAIGSIGEPVHGVTTSYELRFYQVTDAATDQVQLLGTMSPFAPAHPGFAGGVHVDTGTAVRMVMVRTGYDPAARPPAVFLSFIRGAGAIAERAFMGNAQLGSSATDWVGETVFGHAGDGSALSVASLDWEEPTQVRGYSSLGPGTLLYQPVRLDAPSPSDRLPQPMIVDAPHIAAVDGTQTTFFGGDEGVPGAPEYRFYGTSAAAPNAAAVASLGLSYAPALDGAALSRLVVETARGTADGGPVNPYTAFTADFSDAEVFGAGIVDATALLERIYADSPDPGQVSGLAASSITHASLAFAWQAATGVDHYTIELFKGDPVPANSVEFARLAADQLQHTFSGLEAGTAYTVQLVPYSALGKTAPAAVLSATTAAAPVDPKPRPEQPTDTEPRPAGADRLGRTGGSSSAPLIIGAVVLVIIGAATVATAVIRRRKRAVVSSTPLAAEGASASASASASADAEAEADAGVGGDANANADAGSDAEEPPR